MFDQINAPHQFVQTRWFNDIRSLWEIRRQVQWRNPFRALTASHAFALLALTVWTLLQSSLLNSWLGLLWICAVWPLLTFALVRNSLADIALWDWWPIFLGSHVMLAEDREVEGYQWLVQNVPRHMWCRSGQTAPRDCKAFIFMSKQHAMMFKLIHGGS